MSWMTIRKATDKDVAALNAAGVKFANKYIPQISERRLSETDSIVWAIEYEMDVLDSTRNSREVWARERKLWRAQVQRTLGKGATGIAYDYVGYEVKK